MTILKNSGSLSRFYARKSKLWHCLSFATAFFNICFISVFWCGKQIQDFFSLCLQTKIRDRLFFPILFVVFQITILKWNESGRSQKHFSKGLKLRKNQGSRFVRNLTDIIYFFKFLRFLIGRKRKLPKSNFWLRKWNCRTN